MNIAKEERCRDKYNTASARRGVELRAKAF